MIYILVSSIHLQHILYLSDAANIRRFLFLYSIPIIHLIDSFGYNRNANTCKSASVFFSFHPPYGSGPPGGQTWGIRGGALTPQYNIAYKSYITISKKAYIDAVLSIVYLWTTKALDIG